MLQWLECRVPPPIIAALTAAGLWVAARTGPVGATTGLRAVGVTLGLTGLALALWAIASFRRRATTIHPLHPEQASALVVDGPNRWSRNPMYVGLLLVLTGWGCWLGTPWAVAGVPAAWVYLWRFQVQPEERALRARFGAEYDAYASRVRRWL